MPVHRVKNHEDHQPCFKKDPIIRTTAGRVEGSHLANNAVPLKFAGTSCMSLKQLYYNGRAQKIKTPYNEGHKLQDSIVLHTPSDELSCAIYINKC